jgi:dTMP kinase
MVEDENRFEKESRAFYHRVLAAYMAIAKRAPQRVVSVEAADPVADVHKKIVGIVEERLFSDKSLSKQKTL